VDVKTQCDYGACAGDYHAPDCPVTGGPAYRMFHRFASRTAADRYVRTMRNAGRVATIVDLFPEVRSYKVEVIADSSGQWCPNGMRFASEEEARRYGSDLFARWTAVREWRVAPSTDAPNGKADGSLTA
jgi:hypothetical protein